MELFMLEGVQRNFGGRRALDAITLSLDEGEALGVVGESGAGKTTLLRLLAGLDVPTAGTLRWRGRTVDKQVATELRGEATMIFQHPLFIRGSVLDNVAYGLRLRGAPEAEIPRRVSETLAKVRLPGFETRDARKISGGEQQRVSLARALVLDPKVLILDEPTANLDSENASIVSDIIAGEAGTRSVVVASHDLARVGRLAERVIQLEAGRIVAEGGVDVLASNRFGSNVFSGIGRSVNGESDVDVGGGVTIACAVGREGRVAVRVRPEDIIVSKAPVETSARNEYRGRIVGVEESGTIIRLRIDAGRVFTAHITRRTLAEMGLNVGSEVYISFKASAVELL
ncbi:MAG: ABC transporter ATP-binding protein [Candidatus Bathyarchaeota archaeon]|nr:ABC transporter ATP-binding protein [Candidatus Bathyarchaeota archaeon]